jgi:hypothetical protein
VSSYWGLHKEEITLTAAKFRDTYDIVEFSIAVDGARKICWISHEALGDHFGADRDTAVATLLRNMNAIAPVAERVARRTAEGDRVVVKTGDF